MRTARRRKGRSRSFAAGSIRPCGWGRLHPVVPCSLPALSGLYADRVMLEYWPGYRKDDGSCEPSANDLTAQVALALGRLTPRAAVKPSRNGKVVMDVVKATTVNEKVSP